MTSLLVIMCGALTASPELVADGFKFTEGPVWLGAKGWVFSDIPADIVYRDDKTVFRKPSGKSNGLAVDVEGRLYACEHWNRRVTRTEKDGATTVIADKYLGRRLNSPNDLAIRKDGTVFFTDPPYGTEDGERELPFCGVYSVVPGAEPRLLSVGFRSPNGLALSPDQKTLYVGDSEDGYIAALSVAEDGMLEGCRRVALLKTPDGMKTDPQGNLWVGAADGIHVFTAEGSEKQFIPFDKNVSNLAFGGEDGKTLFVTSVDRVFKLKVE